MANGKHKYSINAKEEWFGNIRGDIFGGIVVSLALFPEVMGFCIIAGISPMAGIYTSFFMTLLTSLFGGRPGLVSAAAGSMAFVLASLVRDYGIPYMLAATILTGVFQIILGIIKAGKLIRFVPKSVMTGFVNALGIMMFQSQIGHISGSIELFLLAILGVVIIVFFPKLTKKIPSPIISILVVSLIVVIGKLNVTRLGNIGVIESRLPVLGIPEVGFTAKNFGIILPYSISLAVVGILESLLTAQIVDEKTNTDSNENQECIGQGLGNIASGLFGGIAGCGMIGQTMVNLNYGGRGRLSTLIGGSLMLLAALLFPSVVGAVPVVALASVMIIVAFDTIDWKSIRRISSAPWTESLVMIITVIVVLWTDNLAYGVAAGILVHLIFRRFYH